MRGKYDILWKGMLEEVFEDLLRFIDPEIDKELDLSRGVEFLDKELAEMYPEQEKKSSTRVVDKLVKVYLRDGGERWMLLHVEVQGKNEKGFAERMLAFLFIPPLLPRIKFLHHIALPILFRVNVHDRDPA
jgi:hypothetical protein